MRYGLQPEQPPTATIRVRMVKTTRATLDGGRTVKDYEAGKDYDLPEWLARSFFAGGEGDPAEAYEDKREAMNLETGRAVALKGLDSESARTHSDAATAATGEQQDEGAWGSGARNQGAGEDRQERRPRRSRRAPGE